jgi:hypothetical protein
VTTAAAIVTPEMSSGLPSAVQRYMKFSGVVRKPQEYADSCVSRHSIPIANLNMLEQSRPAKAETVYCNHCSMGG